MRLILVTIIAFSLQFSFGQNWTGAVDSDWNNSANWSIWPLGGEDITIDPINYSGAAADPVIASNSVFIPAAVLVQNGGNLAINANLTTSDDVECLGIGSLITVNSGTFSVNPGDGGRLIFDLGAQCVVNNGTVLVDERFIAGENSLVTINGGTASSGERLLMDLGGQFIQYGGAVNVAAVFAMADGSASQNSGYTLNDGNLNITGEFAIECEAGNFEPFFVQNGGTATVNGDMFWLGVAPGTGRGYFIQNGGISNVSGIIQNMPTSTTGMQFELNNNAVCNITGTMFENLQSTDTLKLTGTSQLNVTQPNFNLNNLGVVHGIAGTIAIDGSCNVTGNGLFQFPNVNLLANSLLIHTTLSPIAINGDLLLNGSYSHQTHALILNGSTLQEVNGNLALVAHDLTINNTNQGVQLETAANVEGNLNLINGVIHTSTSDILTVTEGATASSGNSSSFVSGPMKKIGNTAFVFPLGKNGKWARLGISNPTAITDIFTAEYFDNAFSSLTPVNSPLSGVSGLEYWNLEQTNGTSSVQVELYWEDAAASTITDCNELSVAKWDGSAWVNEFATSSGSCAGNDAGAIQSNSGINGYGNFTFGFYSGVTSQQFEICSGESVVVGTSVYSSSGTYIDILEDINNNDSIVVTSINVTTVNPSIQFTLPEFIAIDQTADAYNWIDCYTGSPLGVSTPNYTPLQTGWYAMVATTNSCADTSACVYFNAVDTTICQGESVLVGTNSYSNQGVYYELLNSTMSQDSVVKLSLNVNLVDTSIVLNSSGIVSNNPNATSFQWYDCNAGLNIANENSNTFAYTSNGSYALIVEENGCTDTSSCISVSNVGLNDLYSNEIRFYPNPTNGKISFSGITNGVTIKIYSISGQLIYNSKMNGDQFIELDVEQGSYFMEIREAGAVILFEKLVII